MPWRLCRISQSFSFLHSSSASLSKSVLLRRQDDGIDGAQLAPAGAAGEKLRVEALRPSVERFLFGFRNRRKNSLNRFEGRACDDRTPDGPKR